MKKMLLAVNPYAGTRKAYKQLADIVAVLNRGDYDVSVYISDGPGDVAQMVAHRACDVDVVACCGGDGTFNETVSGVMKSGADVPIGYIPAGSTNDFAASLRLSTNIMQAAQDILDGEPVSYDVGKFGDRYFSYVASFGAFTRTSYITPQSIKNALGHTAYVLSGISELSQIRKEHVKMELDGHVVEDDYLFGAISNATSVGGVLTLDPRQVDMSDGKLEVLLIRAPVSLMEISDCIQAVQSQTYNCAMMTFRSARKIKVYASPDMLWTLDGEREEGHDEVDVENVHLAIKLMQKVRFDV